jgi:hypothetical protein
MHPSGDERVAPLRELRDEKREMTPRGKPGKLQQRVSTLSTGLGNPAKSTPDSHLSTAPAAGLHQHQRTKNEAQTKFQLTDDASFAHHSCASVASLRS